MFVRQNRLPRIIEDARSTLAEHEDFLTWKDAEESELRCEMR